MNPARPALAARAGGTGRPWPLGASLATEQGVAGVNFAVCAPQAQRLVLCLYDASGVNETARLDLAAFSDGVWHGFVPGLHAGQLYGLRAHGPYDPAQGQRFNPAHLLMDPFARALVGDTRDLSLERDYVVPDVQDGPVLHAHADPQDNAARIPKAQVLDWALEHRAGAALTPGPRVPMARTVLYEAHVKGLTQIHPDVAPTRRGRFAGVASPAMLAHYRRLGITTVCLLPVQLHLTEAHLLKKGLPNYWGYNTLAYFIPMPSYASGEFAHERAEFRDMVDQLHQQGLEVVLDVVYNHSAESDTLGPTLSWRGLGPASAYALDRAGQHLNFSGCGNSFNLGERGVLQLVMDSLRWWVQVFGVDGFRFDLAPSLARDPVLHHAFHPMGGLLAAIGQDPVLAGVKLIAEPWDVGLEGYQLGRFPPSWHEWNDRFRDTSRAFWLGHACTRGEMARRLCGSSDYFQHHGRSPLASINLITTHDGMTLADLTAYREKHNHANGEDNRDGHQHNLSANAGVEGPSDDASVLAVRGQWRRALLSTLFLAQGVPQLLAGDELGHTQHGNNNAYCQDNETTWLDWAGADLALTGFVADLIHLRHQQAALRHPNWFRGSGATDSGAAPDIGWCLPDGSPVTPAAWDDPESRSLVCLLNGADGGQATCPRWLLVLHPHPDALTVTLPPGDWRLVLDSAHARVLPQAVWAQAVPLSGSLRVPPRSVSALVQTGADRVP